jgi:DNA-binding SARP family transcriptional activator
MTPDATIPGLELRLLGGIELRGVSPAGADKVLAQSKAVALLAFLALSPDRGFQRRDLIVGLLWPELDQSHARAALRKVVYEVRGLLGPEVVASRGDDDLAILPDVLHCDVEAFNAACDRGRLVHALELYRGEFMPGFFLTGCLEFERWVDDQRTSARERAAAASWALAQTFEGESQFSNAGSWARRTVRHAWNDERVLRRALAMLDRIGDRAGAVKLYEDFAARLRADLDVEPSPETNALVKAIRTR